MRLFLKTYGASRLIALLLFTVSLAYELGMPGHSVFEALCVMLYVACLVEAATFVWK